MLQNKIKFDEEGNIVVEFEEFYNQLDYESIIFNLSEKEVALIVLRYMGYRPIEIVDILKLNNIGVYYGLNYRLKKRYRKTKMC